MADRFGYLYGWHTLNSCHYLVSRGVIMTFWKRIKKFIEDTFGPEGLFSSAAEGHAFLIGICETVAFWKPRHEMPPEYGHDENEANGHPLEKEWHYYAFGRFCGVLFWLWCIIPVCILIYKAVIL